MSTHTVVSRLDAVDFESAKEYENYVTERAEIDVPFETNLEQYDEYIFIEIQSDSHIGNNAIAKNINMDNVSSVINRPISQISFRWEIIDEEVPDEYQRTTN